MGLKERIEPYMKDALLEIPVAHRVEVSDAMAEELRFEAWRIEQEPEVADTPVNRANFFAADFARLFAQRIRNIVTSARATAATESVGTELDS